MGSGAQAVNTEIRLDNVSKFYGEVMGVNGITATLDPGVTGLVGSNGAGKSTLMNLIAGLVRPSRGRIDVLGRSVENPRLIAHDVGYCAQYDAFPPGLSGREFMVGSLRLYGYTANEAGEGAAIALDRLGLADAADRRIDVYSKGMRQALKVARAIGHGPRVLLLDEPLNGLDPQARAEATAVFRDFADNGAHVLISSHILHELDAVSDRVVFLDGGYLVASGDVAEIRDEARRDVPAGRDVAARQDDTLGADAARAQIRPVRVSIRCDRAAHVASRLFGLGAVVEARVHDDGGGLSVRAADADAFFRRLGELVCADDVRIEGVAPVDASVGAVYAELVWACRTLMDHVPVASPAPFVRQVAAVFRIEVSRIMRPRHSLPAFLLAALPVGVSAVVSANVTLDRGGAFPAVFYNLLLGVTVFFGCAFIFTKLFRSEILERTLHYYLLAPIQARSAAPWQVRGWRGRVVGAFRRCDGRGLRAPVRVAWRHLAVGVDRLARQGRQHDVARLHGLRCRVPAVRASVRQSDPAGGGPAGMGRAALPAAADVAGAQRALLPRRVDVRTATGPGRTVRDPGALADAVGFSAHAARPDGRRARTGDVAPAPAGGSLHGRLTSGRSGLGVAAYAPFAAGQDRQPGIEADGGDPEAGDEAPPKA